MKHSILSCFRLTRARAAVVTLISLLIVPLHSQEHYLPVGNVAGKAAVLPRSATEKGSTKLTTFVNAVKLEVADTDRTDSADKTDNSQNPPPDGRSSETKTLEKFINSLGMQFVMLPDSRLRVSVWETRVMDFTHFVNDTGYDATTGMYSPGRDGWKQRGHTWLFPGFSQTPSSPVCGVNSYDAIAFCEWLTRRERKTRMITENQEYRLPKAEEWFTYVGKGRFPWGTSFPPNDEMGKPLANVGGEDIRDGNWPDSGFVITGFKDGFPRSSPAGSFKPNEFGIYDTGGNVKEWSSDWYTEGKTPVNIAPEAQAELRVILGSGWSTGDQSDLMTRRGDVGVVWPKDRIAVFGFRVVLTEK